MPRRPDRIRQVHRSGAAIFIKKASEFFDSMQHAMQVEQWNAAGLNAVHCALSACDAVLVFFTEQRFASPDHDAAANLLESLNKIPQAKQKADTLRRILREKNLIECEEREITHRDAAELTRLTERFYRWAHRLIS